jgi:hypothetical protein
LRKRYPAVQRFGWVMNNLNTHWGMELCWLFARLNGVHFEPRKLRRGRERRAF